MAIGFSTHKNDDAFPDIDHYDYVQELSQPLTKKEKEKLNKWIQAQTYSGSVDNECVEYLRADELKKYLPNVINEIIKARKQ